MRPGAANCPNAFCNHLSSTNTVFKKAGHQIGMPFELKWSFNFKTWSKME